MLVLLIAVLIFSLFSGCSNKANEEGVSTPDPEVKQDQTAKPDPVVNLDPVTLVMYQKGPVLTDEEFARFFADPVKEQFPHITLELVRAGEGMQPQDLITAGNFPDIVFFGSKQLNEFENINSALREANEAANQAITAEK